MKSLTKIIAFSLAMLALYSFSSHSPADFSGLWKLNKSKSELGEYGEMMVGATVKIEQKTDRIIFTNTGPSFEGEETTATSTLTFDGKQTESTIWGSGKRKSSLKWTEDGRSFTVTYTSAYQWDGQTMEDKGTEVWRLSNDDKSISLQSFNSSSYGETVVKVVYEKQ